MKKSQMTRILEFDRQVRDGEYPNSLRFSVDYEVSQRTVLRDIEYIRDQLGAPLQYDTARRGFHYTDDWDLPHIIPLTVLHDDASARILTLFQSLNVDEQIEITRKLNKILVAEGVPVAA